MTKKRTPILNEEQTKVNLFVELIRIDKDLPKYKIMEKKKAVSDNKGKTNNNDIYFVNGFSFSNDKLEEITYKSLKEYFESNTQDNMTDFNLTLSDKMRHNIEKTTMANNLTSNVMGESRHAEKSFFMVNS